MARAYRLTLYAARSVGWVELARAGRTERASLSELDPLEAAPVLREYARAVPVTRPFFDANPDSPLDEFIAEASRHPVFQLRVRGQGIITRSRGAAMRIKDVITRDVATVAPDASLRSVAAVLTERGISGVPVVDEGGRVLGVISATDVVALEHQPGITAPTARDAMTSPAITIDLDRRVHEAASLMTTRGVNRLPVLNDGALVGIVSRADLVRAFVRTDADIKREIENDVVDVLRFRRERVDIVVAEGEVTLGGQLETRADAELLVRFAEHALGVSSVRSTLTWARDDVRPGDGVADQPCADVRGLDGRFTTS
jgi:CBS domain-containing protein